MVPSSDAAQHQESEPLAQLRYELLPAWQWDRYGAEIDAIEDAIFHEHLKQHASELQEVFVNPEALFVTALDGEEVAGFVCGEDLWHYVEEGDPEHDPLLERERTAYVETIDVKPGCQGRGIGKGLLQAFIDEARRRGYRHVAGHWRQGASLGLITKLGGKVRMAEEDYLGTGETYSYVVLDLSANL